MYLIVLFSRGIFVVAEIFTHKKNKSTLSKTKFHIECPHSQSTSKNERKEKQKTFIFISRQILPTKMVAAKNYTCVICHNCKLLEIWFIQQHDDTLT